MKNKPYNTKEEPVPSVAEPVSVYGLPSVSNDDMLSTLHAQNASVSKVGRMTVEEYFGEVRRVLHKKYEDVQG